jgi:hypothetical protein
MWVNKIVAATATWQQCDKQRSQPSAQPSSTNKPKKKKAEINDVTIM